MHEDHEGMAELQRAYSVPTPASLVAQVDLLRLEAARRLDPGRRSELGQFMTPAAVAQLMASMLGSQPAEVRLLDAGAGVGSLLSAGIAALCQREPAPRSIHVTAYEIDPTLTPYLAHTLKLCGLLCEHNGIVLTSEILEVDFVAHVAARLSSPLWSAPPAGYTCALLNPPYRKIHTASLMRRQLRNVGIETSNIYTGFLALAVQLLAPSGELVAITPRSFCNGPYFRPFRELLLKNMALRRFHLFEARDQAFQDDEVLQENIIIAAVKSATQPACVEVTTSTGPDDDMPTLQERPYTQVVHVDDPQRFIHLVADDVGSHVAERIALFKTSLAELGVQVSTGRVVDFRALEFLRAEPDAESKPLIYPLHLVDGRVVWPRSGSKKPNALAYTAATRNLFVPNEPYVLVKRFSSKEERRRVVATVHNPASIADTLIGIENHLNYFHERGRGIDLALARGLTAFLNSTLIDTYFRQFNGHTQVNAADLRNLRYPTRAQLVALGRRIDDSVLSQDALDDLITRELMADSNLPQHDPILVKRRVDEALALLRALDFPRAQQNERSALTLLALLDLTPEKSWPEATAPLCGITPMMEFFSQHYGKQYKPNTRETVRRQTVHQFLDAGLVVANPDEPARPVNSPRAVYQIESAALALVRSYGTADWEQSLQSYLASAETLRQRYAQERAMQRLPVTISTTKTLTLSPGNHNILIKQIIDNFAPRFTPGGEVLYVGDTDEKFAHFDSERLRELGVLVASHGKMPDVVVYHASKGWLVLVEAVTSHGPINPKRRSELARLFQSTTVGLVYVTAFLSRQALKEYLAEISWETEVWVAESPDHLIHFNGERFLGPYDGS